MSKKPVSWLSCNTPGFIGVLHPCFFEKNHGVKPHLRSQTGPGRIVYLAVALATGDFWCHVKPLICSTHLAMYELFLWVHRNLPPANSESVLHPRLARDGQPGTTNSTKNDRGHGGCYGVLGIKVCISTSGIFRNNAS